ncbi:NAD(P)-dependent oxidoreductase [Candidiatus Paracoxiella cheracis]|uniref:NAD(P)-dependent oxidoreductase n=1 Tax=Candidiatus Paracoxiella cheracis TaxID=3405120 RepID=UPI003BF5DB9D
MTTIGFIGLGHMGNPMVKNLLKNKYHVKVFDLNQEAMQALVQEGAVVAESLADIANDSDVVITMLQKGNQVAQCCLGDEGVFAHLNKPDALFIDSSSIDVMESRKIHEQAKSQNIAMVDAPVSGGVAAATAATLTFMVGGETHHFEKAKSILNVMGKNIIHAGRDGNGAAAKICNNMLLGISMIGVSEAFVLAEKLGLDAKKLYDISSKASGVNLQT